MAAYLTRLKGSSREHAESDLRCFLAWSAERGLDPLAGLPDRWWVRAAVLQHMCRSGRRLSVTARCLAWRSGTGKRLFRQTQPIPLRLTGCVPTTTGVLLLSYQPEPQ